MKSLGEKERETKRDHVDRWKRVEDDDDQPAHERGNHRERAN